MTPDQQALADLAGREIERIKALPQPVVRVCGPLTCDGPEGYERNAKRLTDAEQVLAGQGMSVWNFDESEQEIFGRNYTHDDIYTHFHWPVLESGFIKTAYFLPRWQESNGATLERQKCEEFGIEVKEFPEEWFADMA